MDKMSHPISAYKINIMQDIITSLPPSLVTFQGHHRDLTVKSAPLTLS